jgi:hypothetical protein
MVPGSLGLGSVVLARMTMLAPSAAARLAMARPMPRDAPVMKRVLPDRSGADFNEVFTIFPSGALQECYRFHSY